jgi:hypothetical protein
MVQDSGTAERKREREAGKDVGGSAWVDVGAGGRERIASAGFARRIRATVQVWTGGGHGINGSTSETGVWNLGLRYGLILTSPHGPGFLKGQLEYAFDVVPAWVLTQKTNTAYGGGVNPFAFKWILSEPKKVKPFFEIEGGTLFTTTKVPENTSQINFTSSGALRNTHSWRETQLERRSAGTCTFQCGDDHAQSEDQHDQVRIGWGCSGSGRC